MVIYHIHDYKQSKTEVSSNDTVEMVG